MREPPPEKQNGRTFVRPFHTLTRVFSGSRARLRSTRCELNRTATARQSPVLGTSSEKPLNGLSKCACAWHFSAKVTFNEPERRAPMRLDGNALPTSRIGVRRSCKVHGPNAPPKLEVKALPEAFSEKHNGRTFVRPFHTRFFFPHSPHGLPTTRREDSPNASSCQSPILATSTGGLHSKRNLLSHKCLRNTHHPLWLQALAENPSSKAKRPDFHPAVSHTRFFFHTALTGTNNTL